MRWKVNETRWPLCSPTEISDRLVAGIDEMRATLVEDESGVGSFEAFRLRTPPLGDDARTSKSRFLAWDNLIDVASAATRDIASALQSAALFVEREHNCGRKFEVQVCMRVRATDPITEKSISFSLDDPAIGGGDEEGEEGQRKALDIEDLILRKLLGDSDNPANVIALMGFHTQRVLAAALERESRRVDRYHTRALESPRDSIEPLVTTSGQMLRTSMTMMTSLIERERTAHAHQADLDYKRERLATAKEMGTSAGQALEKIVNTVIGSVLGGMGISFGGSEPAERPASPPKRPRPQPSSSTSSTAGEAPNDPNEPRPARGVDDLGENPTAVEIVGILRERLDDESMAALVAVDEGLARRFADFDPESASPETEVSAIVRGFAEALRGPNALKLVALARALDEDGRVLIQMLLELARDGALG